MSFSDFRLHAYAGKRIVPNWLKNHGDIKIMVQQTRYPTDNGSAVPPNCLILTYVLTLTCDVAIDDQSNSHELEYKKEQALRLLYQQIFHEPLGILYEIQKAIQLRDAETALRKCEEIKNYFLAKEE